MIRFLPLLLSLLGTAVVADDAARPPNVVVFLVDDLGWADPGFQGHRFHETPHVDALAEQGLRFTAAYAACPVCSPTRASLVTGRYPATIGLTDFIAGHWRPFEKSVVPRFHHALPHAEVTFAELLKPHGYVSAAYGKWHLGGASHLPGTQGFDDWIVTSMPAFAPRFHIHASRPFPARPQEYQAEYLTRAAERFLAENAHRPFLLYLSHSDVHVPLEAEQRLLTKYRDKARKPEFAPTLTATLHWRGTPPETLEAVVEHLESRGKSLAGSTSIRSEIGTGVATTTVALDPAADLEAARQLFVRNVELVTVPEGASIDVRVSAVNNPVYAAMCEHVDESLGRVLAKLDELQIADDTLVLFTSDNGGLYRRYDEAGPATSTQHPLRGEKGSLYEGGIRVPCLVRWPGVVAAGRTSAVPISSVDILPTIAEASGVAVPANVDGLSLVPLLKGAESLDRKAIFWHYPHYHHTSPVGAIRAGRYKLLEYFDDERIELYDLEADPGEFHNLTREQPDQAIELRRTLAAWRKDAGAQLPTPNPAHDPNRAAEWGNPRERGF